MTCPICQFENTHLAVVCSRCGSYLQGRVDNLDLFSTAWRVVENPRRTFYAIATARHKNYGLVLSALGGIAITFLLFWRIHAGDHTSSILQIVAAGVVVGIPSGVVSMVLLAGLVVVIALFYRIRVKPRNAFAVAAYSLIPLTGSFPFLLPIKLLTFGSYFFSTNPSPWLLKPLSYGILLGLDGTAFIWSVILYFTGLRVVLGTTWGRVLVVGGAATGILSGIIVLAVKMFHLA